jgi:hypothetical protein
LSCLVLSCTRLVLGERSPLGRAAALLARCPPPTASNLDLLCGADRHPSPPFALSGSSVSQRGIFAQTTELLVPAKQTISVSWCSSTSFHFRRSLRARSLPAPCRPEQHAPQRGRGNRHASAGNRSARRCRSMRQPPDQRPHVAGRAAIRWARFVRAAAWYDASQTRVLKAPRSLRYTALDRAGRPPPRHNIEERAMLTPALAVTQRRTCPGTFVGRGRVQVFIFISPLQF